MRQVYEYFTGITLKWQANKRQFLACLQQNTFFLKNIGLKLAKNKALTITGELDIINCYMLNTTEQFRKLVETSKRPLVVFGLENNDDSAAAAVALTRYLESKGKRTSIASSNYATPARLSFLLDRANIEPELKHLHKFTIKVDVSKAKLETLSYDVKDNWLSIHLTPRSGTITKNDLRTLQTGFKYDLIIALGTADLESLGDIFFNNTDLFYRTPIINIDCHPSNEHYGAVNLVDLTATSVSEMIYRVFADAGHDIDSVAATAILTGMIAKTRSFKTPNVTPNTLNLAGKLMDKGADREKIIHNLYRTKSIASLKLWGKALSNLQKDRDLDFVWTQITRDDFTRSGANSNDLHDLVSELIANSPEAKIILLLFEDEHNTNKIRGLLTTDKNFDALLVAKPMMPAGNKRSCEFSLDNISLKQAEEHCVNEIKKQVNTIAGKSN